jgi:hypothetical protein
VRNGLAVLDDGRALDVTDVIWCTGFRPDFSWIHLPVTGDDGWPLQERGVAASRPPSTPNIQFCAASRSPPVSAAALARIGG